MHVALRIFSSTFVHWHSLSSILSTFIHLHPLTATFISTISGTGWDRIGMFGWCGAKNGVQPFKLNKFLRFISFQMQEKIVKDRCFGICGISKDADVSPISSITLIPIPYLALCSNSTVNPGACDAGLWRKTGNTFYWTLLVAPRIFSLAVVVV